MEVSQLWEDTSGSDAEDGGYSDSGSIWPQRASGVTLTNNRRNMYPPTRSKITNYQSPELPATPAQLPLAATAPSPTTPFPTPQHAVSSVTISQLLADGYSGTIAPCASAVRASQPGPPLRSPTTTPPTTPLRPATPASTPVRGSAAPALGANVPSTGNAPAPGAEKGMHKRPAKSLSQQLPPGDLVAALERELAEIEHRYIHTGSSDLLSATRRSTPGSRPRSRGSTPGALSSGGGAASVVCSCGAVLAVPVYDDGVYGTGMTGVSDQPSGGGGAGSDGAVPFGHVVQQQASHVRQLHPPLHQEKQLQQAAGALQQLSVALEVEAEHGGQALGAAGQGAGSQGTSVSGHGSTLRAPPPSPALVAGGAACVGPARLAGLGAAAWGRNTAAVQGHERDAHAAAGPAAAPYASAGDVGTGPRRGSNNGGGGGGSVARSLLLEFEALAEADWQQQQRQHFLPRAFADPHGLGAEDASWRSSTAVSAAEDVHGASGNVSSAPSSTPLSQGGAGGSEGGRGPPSLAGASWAGGSGGGAGGGDGDGASTSLAGAAGSMESGAGSGAGAGDWGSYLQGFRGGRGRHGWALESDVASSASEVTLQGLVVQGPAEATDAHSGSRPPGLQTAVRAVQGGPEATSGAHGDNGAPDGHAAARVAQVGAIHTDSREPAEQLSGEGKGAVTQSSMQAAGLGARYPEPGAQDWPGPSANVTRDPDGVESALEPDCGGSNSGQGGGDGRLSVGLRVVGAGSNGPPACPGRPGQLPTVHRHHHSGRTEQPAFAVLSHHNQQTQRNLHTQSVRQELGEKLQEDKERHVLQRHMQPALHGHEYQHHDHWHSVPNHRTHRRYQLPVYTDRDRNQTAQAFHTERGGRDPRLLDSLPDCDLEAMAGELLRTLELGLEEGVGEVQQGCAEGSEVGMVAHGGADGHTELWTHGGMAGAGGLVGIPGGGMWEAEAVGPGATGGKRGSSGAGGRAGGVGGWADSALEEAERSARRTALSALHARLDELQARYDSKRRMLRSLRRAAASSPTKAGHEATRGGSGGAPSARHSAGGWVAPDAPGVAASGGGPRPSPSLAAILASMASPSRGPGTQGQPAGRAAAAAGDSYGGGGGCAVDAAASSSPAAVAYGRSSHQVGSGSASAAAMPQLRTQPIGSSPAQPSASIAPTSKIQEHPSAALGQQAPTHTSHYADSHSHNPSQPATHTTDHQDGQEPNVSKHQGQHHGSNEEHEALPGRRLPPPANRQELQELLRLLAAARSLPQLRPLDRVLLWARLEEALALRLSHSPPQGEQVFWQDGGPSGREGGIGQQGTGWTGGGQCASSWAEGGVGAPGNETSSSGAREVGEGADGSGYDGMVEGLQVEGSSSRGLAAGMYDKAGPPRRGYARIWAAKHPGGAARARAGSDDGAEPAPGPVDAGLHQPATSSAVRGSAAVSRAVADANSAAALGASCADGSSAQSPPGGWCGGLGSPVLDGTLDAVHRVVAPNACLARALTLNWQAMRDRALRLQQQQQRDGAKGGAGSSRRRGSRYALSPRDVLEEMGSSSSSS